MKDKHKIIKIIDEYTLIINAGSTQGVEYGDTFQILDKEGSEVHDPDSGELLGYMDSIKDTVKASEIQEKMCICTSLKYTNFGSALALIQSSVLPEKKRLNIDYSQVTGGLRQSDKPIQIGDIVRLIKTAEK